MDNNENKPEGITSINDQLQFEENTVIQSYEDVPRNPNKSLFNCAHYHHSTHTTLPGNSWRHIYDPADNHHNGRIDVTCKYMTDKLK